MLIGGLQKLTLIDYPGKVACTVFTVGCNFRCLYCHNPELVATSISSEHRTISEKDFFNFLKVRQGLLDGVCVTGGEPLLHNDLPEFLNKIKNLKFKIKVDTNGAKPDKLQKLIEQELVDYVAMDIKAPSIKNQKSKIKNQKYGNLYEKVVGVKVNLANIKKSVKIIMDSGLDYEFRTTVVPELLEPEGILEIAKEIRGAKRYYIQQFKPSWKLLNQKFKNVKPYPLKVLNEIRNQIKDFFEVCEVRG